MCLCVCVCGGIIYKIIIILSVKVCAVDCNYMDLFIPLKPLYEYPVICVQLVAAEN